MLSLVDSFYPLQSLRLSEAAMTSEVPYDIVAGPLFTPEDTGLMCTACPGQRSVSCSAVAATLKPQA